MNAEEHGALEGRVLPVVAGLIGAPVEDLSLVKPGSDGEEAWGSVYWQAWFVCDMHITGDEMELDSWNDRFKQRDVVVPFGTPDPGDEPDDWWDDEAESRARLGGWDRAKGQCRHGIDFADCSLCG